MELHRLLHRRQTEADRARGDEPQRRRARRQRGDVGEDAAEIVEDDARIGQHRSVVGDQRRRLQQRIDLREFRRCGGTAKSAGGRTEPPPSASPPRRAAHRANPACRSVPRRPPSKSHVDSDSMAPRSSRSHASPSRTSRRPHPERPARAASRRTRAATRAERARSVLRDARSRGLLRMREVGLQRRCDRP